jgi:ATP-dependent Clp protease protease subunit
VLRTKDRLNQLLADHTGQPLEKIQKDTDRDFFMSGEEAVEYGLIDTVLSRREPAESGEDSAKDNAE